MRIDRSLELFTHAKNLIPGGVNSPVRAFKSVGGNPIFIKRGDGSRMYDVDGNTYVDYVCSWGPLITGHAHPKIVAAIRAAAENGTTFGASTEAEVTLARMIVDAVQSVEMVRLVNSGTEAVMSAIRLARGCTGRTKIVKFDGCYHGHSDSLLAKAGSGIATLGLPDSMGVPQNLTADTITLPYNDITAAQETLATVGSEVACVILEPISGNMGVVPPKPGFLQELRELTRRHSALLIFDEVITGFRVSYGGAQELYGVTPDLTTLGKIIGGGLPMGAYGGRRSLMEQVAPSGPVYQAGTLSGNPLAVAAGIEMLTLLKEDSVYAQLDAKASSLQQGLAEAAAKAGIPSTINRVGSMMTAFFTDVEVVDYASAKTSSVARYAQFFTGMLERGFYFAPSRFEAAFVSTAHSNEDIAATISAVEDLLRVMAR